MTQPGQNTSTTTVPIPAQTPGSPAAGGQSSSGRLAHWAERTHRKCDDFLVRLGGADLNILAKASGAGRIRFSQMGLVLLSTAGLAVLSMSFALVGGLDLNPFVALLGGLLWGFIILNLDRMLILNLDLRGGFWRVLAVVMPRVFLAALLGIVISTPLVLQVFQVEIQKQIALTQTAEEEQFGTDFDNTAIGRQLEEVRTEIATYDAALRGEAAPLETAEVVAQQQYLADANTRYAQLKEVSDRAYRQWQCELYGNSCEGGSARSGDGVLAQAREREYEDALDQTNAAERQVDQIQTALDTARAAAGTQSSEDLARQQERASAELPALRDREAELQEAYEGRFDDRNTRIDENDGLLAQIVALTALSEGNNEARLTHIAVGALFFMIELLPVLVKILTSLGAPTLYERIREQLEIAWFDDASSETRLGSQDRDQEEHRVTAEARKRQDIADDMRERELKLGMKANERVAAEMEGVLQAALADWAQKVQQTLHQNATSNGTSQGGGARSYGGTAAQAGTSSNGAPSGRTAPTVPAQTTSTSSAAPSRPNADSSGAASSTDATTRLTVRTAFNMPDGDNL